MRGFKLPFTMRQNDRLKREIKVATIGRSTDTSMPLSLEKLE
jgi:hypothetical protein